MIVELVDPTPIKSFQTSKYFIIVKTMRKGKLVNIYET